MNRYTRPNPEHAALLTIDMQRDFVEAGGSATIDGTADRVPEMQRLVEAFRSAGRPIIHVTRLYKRDGSNVDPCRRDVIEEGAEIVRPGSDGAELVRSLLPEEGIRLDPDRLLDGELQEIGPQEWVMYKPRWGAFYDTTLEAFLSARSIDTLAICGCNFPNCPRTTIYEASERDYPLVFVADATSGVYQRGIDELENIGVNVRDTDRAVEWIAEPA